MYTLGINAAFHDPAACLVRDGVVVAAAEEERFTHVKHGKRPVPFSTWELPFHATDFCLRQAGITLADVDHVAYSFDPWLLLGRKRGDKTVPIPLHPGEQKAGKGFDGPWDPLFLASIVNAPGFLLDAVPLHLRARFRGVRFGSEPYRWHWVPHHLAHAASAFHCSPFSQAAVLTLDGRGEKATTGYAVGEGNRLEWLGQVQMPHSLGMLYERVTEYLGFLHGSDEYKVMALASFGRPRFLAEFRDVVRLGADGSYTINELRPEERFGPARLKGGPLDQRHYDVAHSLQVVLEETVLDICKWLRDTTRLDDLCMAGGVALNCVMNARVRDRGPFKRIWVQPAAGDAGTALGAALHVAQEAGDDVQPMGSAALGRAWSDDEIEACLREAGVRFERPRDVAEETARTLERNGVVGWFQGASEYGPRALGHRSLLASPADADNLNRLNDIKGREQFRPVAPMVKAARADEIFAGPLPSPYMLFVHVVGREWRERIPAVVHVDGTARVQTVDAEAEPLVSRMLDAFERRTGLPVVVNTSFNTAGRPMVDHPRDALECFGSTPIDLLAIGPFVLRRGEAA
jgi:carbamoyltransferase